MELDSLKVIVKTLEEQVKIQQEEINALTKQITQILDMLKILAKLSPSSTR